MVKRIRTHKFTVTVETYDFARRLRLRMQTNGMQLKNWDETWRTALYALERELDRLEEKQHE